MPPAVFQVFENEQVIYEGNLDDCIEFGRQEESVQAVFKRMLRTGVCRINIAKLSDKSVTRAGVRVNPLTLSRVQVKNMSERSTVEVNGGDLSPLATAEYNLPISLTVGSKIIRFDVEAPSEEDSELQSLAAPTLAPGTRSSIPHKRGKGQSFFADGSHESLVDWFRSVTSLLHSAANSEEFFLQAAQAMVDHVGLDCGRVLIRGDDDWRPVAVASAEVGPALSRYPSRRMLNRLLEEKRTFWQTGGGSFFLSPDNNSLMGVQTVVASPILSPSAEVIGALYGERLGGHAGMSSQITQLEAVLVETLASGVAAGLARIEQQKLAVAAQVKFEQFFTPQLAEHLTQQPDLLAGRDALVTLLFGDVRGFSRISERLTPAETVRWIGGVMGVLSDCVAAHQGVLVDYIGDEIVAMWGAPAEQPDHAQLACAAALDMLESLDPINAEWEAKLGEPTRVGIGLNTGMAHVGNTGSARKFKYGPLGNTVNLASRVQGATKYLRTELVVTASTQSAWTGALKPRRLCQVRVVNIKEPVNLYQLPLGAPRGWESLCTMYDRALTEFEAMRFPQAAQILGKLVAEFPDDGPALMLLGRAVNFWISGDAVNDTVWDLPGK